MGTVASTPQPAGQALEQIASADLLVGVVAELDPAGLAAIAQDLRSLPGSPRVLILHRTRDVAPDVSPVAEADGSITLMSWSQFKLDDPAAVVQGIAAAYEFVFVTGGKLGVAASCVIASKLDPAQPDWAAQLIAPVLENKFDLALPRYGHHPFEGLLNSSIVSPLSRCLYAKRFQNPMGPDIAMARALAQKMAGDGQNSSMAARQVHPLASLTSTALCGNLRACQVHIGSRVYPAPDWNNASSLMAQVLGPVFLDMERNAACWQRTRASVPVPSFGGTPVVPPAVAKDTDSVDSGRLVSSFQLGARDLQEVWGLVLPPATLLEIVKLSRAAPEQFHMPDELWVRIVYDFALAHRLRTINRDHLLRSLTPLYLGWVASFARELESKGSEEAARSLERLAFVFESDKSYLVSRWRWPDRFNP